VFRNPEKLGCAAPRTWPYSESAACTYSLRAGCVSYEPGPGTSAEKIMAACAYPTMKTGTATCFTTGLRGQVAPSWAWNSPFTTLNIQEPDCATVHGRSWRTTRFASRYLTCSPWAVYSPQLLRPLVSRRDSKHITYKTNCVCAIQCQHVDLR